MTAPDRIWLQTSGDYEGASAAMDEVTWCDQPMEDGDHEYLLLDGPTMKDAIAAARAEGREQGLREVKDAVAAQANEVWRQFCEDAISALIPAPPADGGET